MTIEILAPAGGQEQLVAAVRSGADAVYLGTGNFNARRNAENFDEAALKGAVEYCHGRGVNVYVTMNTLVKDMELAALYKEIELLAASGVDAVIVQDLAVAELFKRHCPSMPLHASTQMSIHNLDGVLFAEEMGFSRVVLARELSLQEIEKIARGSNIEIEVFVHGALCMSISGQCYLSSILGGRSGNRGLCAQPCRLDFHSGQRDHALSLKDMSHIAAIDKLIGAGITSLKIEGRMKKPEYVAAAVLACREKVSGQPVDLSDLRAIFSRSGFTDGYLTGKRGLDMFGYRTREDEEAGKTVRGKIASGYRNELSRIPVDMRLTLKEKEKAHLKVTDGKFIIAVQGDIPEADADQEQDHDFAFRSLMKTGGTPFALRTLDTEKEGSLKLPPGKLNAMRREALDKLLEARSRIIPRKFIPPFDPPRMKKQERSPILRVRIENQQQLFAGIDQADRIYLPCNEIDLKIMDRFGDKLIGEMPRLIFPAQEKMVISQLAKLQEAGLQHVCAGNPGSIRLAKRLGFVVHGGFDLNILNSWSQMKYESMGLADTILSFELRLSEAVRLGGTGERGIIGYGHLPLMTFRNCPAKTDKGCDSCDGQPQITDRIGASFTITCSDRHYSTLHNPLPLYLADKDIRAADFVILYFTIEDVQACGKIWQDYTRKKLYEGDFTRGLYYRKLI